MLNYINVFTYLKQQDGQFMKIYYQLNYADI